MWFAKKNKVDAARDSDFDPIGSLQDAASAARLEPGELNLRIVFAPGDPSHRTDRTVILLGEGTKFATWRVESLRALFRGDRQPPPDDVMAHYPEAYVPFFYRVEHCVRVYCDTARTAPTDAEFLDLYSQMRRRPDGRSVSALHDVIWQSAALALGVHPWSEAEYTAVFGQLARSARHFKLGATSRNYMDYIAGRLGSKPGF
jgi:hypothetical protein